MSADAILAHMVWRKSCYVIEEKYRGDIRTAYGMEGIITSQSTLY
jgi:hypothetical protein